MLKTSDIFTARLRRPGHVTGKGMQGMRAE
jgi:hypothetical protein